MLEGSEMQGALTRLTALSMRASEAAARQKTEMIISSELKKAASKPELLRRVAAISPLSGLHSTKVSFKILSLPVYRLVQRTNKRKNRAN